MPRVMSITGALVAMLIAAPGAFAQVTSDQDARPSPWPTVGRDTGTSAARSDSGYIRQAIRSNFTEVALGRLAEDRAENSEVKEFAERMVSDHNSINEQWATVAQNNGMKILGPDFGPAGEQSIEQLEDLSDAEFDQAYMGEMIRNHELDLAAFERMGSSARSFEVRQLANSSESSVRQHLALARQVGSRVGVSSTAGQVGGLPAPTPRPSDDARRRTEVDPNDRDDRKELRPLRAEDRAFVGKILSDHLMHIRLARRAQREAGSNDIREFAERIEKDFTKWSERWQDMAGRHGVEADPRLDRWDRNKLERLDKAKKRDFDRIYTAIVAENLESLVPKLRKESNEERAAGVGRLAEKELPLFREIMADARRLEKEASKSQDDSDKK